MAVVRSRPRSQLIDLVARGVCRECSPPPRRAGGAGRCAIRRRVIRRAFMDTSSGDFAAPSSVVRADSPVMHILFIVCAVGFYFLADRLHLKFLRGVEGELNSQDRSSTHRRGDRGII